jgi:hypothetical protein
MMQWTKFALMLRGGDSRWGRPRPNSSAEALGFKWGLGK